MSAAFFDRDGQRPQPTPAAAGYGWTMLSPDGCPTSVGRMDGRRRRWLPLGSLILAGGLMAAGCSSDDEPQSAGGAGTSSSTSATAPTSAPPETTTTTRARTPEEEVLAAYQGYWKAVDEAFDPPQADPESPALRMFATGEELPGIIEAARQTRAANEVVAIPPNSIYEHRARVLALDGDTATVRDCNIDDLVRTSTVTGAVVDDEVFTKLYTAMLVRESGQWKVAVVNKERDWEGVAGCAVEPS